MPDLPPAAPHDALFRALLADPGRAETLVREYLPPAVAAELSDAPIRRVDASFVDAVLRQSHSDRLFEARLKGGGAGSGLAALVAAFRGQPEEGVLRRILSGLPDGSELEMQVLSYIVRTYELTPAVLETAARVAKPERWEALMSTVAEAWQQFSVSGGSGLWGGLAVVTRPKWRRASTLAGAPVATQPGLFRIKPCGEPLPVAGRTHIGACGRRSGGAAAGRAGAAGGMQATGSEATGADRLAAARVASSCVPALGPRR